MDNSSEEQWVSTGEAAKILGVSRVTMVRLLEARNTGIRWRRVVQDGHRQVHRQDAVDFRDKTVIRN